MKEVFSEKREVPQSETTFDEYEVTEEGSWSLGETNLSSCQYDELPVDIEGWQGLNCFIEISSVREIGEEKSEEKRYYISSLEDGAEAIANIFEVILGSKTAHIGS